VPSMNRRVVVTAAGAVGLGLATGGRRVAAQVSTPQTVQTGQVAVEGSQIAFDIQGEGEPLLLIPGAPGEASDYAQLAALLAADYTVITYDPRGFGRSVGPAPLTYEIGQQARDVVAVLAAAGFEQALIMGSSAGALIGLELATNHPDMVRGLVAHEPPSVRALPDAADLQQRIAAIYLAGWTDGPKWALLEFLVLSQLPANNGQPFTQAEIEQIRPSIDSVPLLDVATFYVPYQLLPLTNYLPDVARIQENGVKIVMGAGEISLDKPFGRTAQALAEQLGSPFVTFPGHHASYLDPSTVEMWAASLRDALHQA
jgi:pimeloyl-ACP methyl ester carboxylesterase